MIAVLADDLTSALDGAAPFASRGLAARVSLAADVTDHHDVVAFDLDSRFVEPGVAHDRFEDAARGTRAASVVFKTVDSTLRGNIAAEIAGALAGSGRTRAVIAPAFPAAGRTTVGGRQFADGVALEQTAFSRDPRTPVTSSLIGDRLHGLAQTAYEVHDAASDGDLDRLVAQLSLGADILWVGSPGLAAALARALPIATRKTTVPACNRVLVVVGSLHPANEAQLVVLVSSGAAIVRLGPADKVAIEQYAQEIASAFADHHTVCLLAPPRDTPVDPAQTADALGRIVALSAACFEGLVATGGDTTRRIIDAIGVTSLDLAGEIEPGVPFGLLCSPGNARVFATKAGGFGDANTLARCATRLRGRAESRP